VRDNFFAARTYVNLDDLNTQAENWCVGQAADRPCPEDGKISVRQAFTDEQPRLMALPANPYPSEEQVTVKAGKTPYVRFDLNDYSIPHTHVQRLLTVRADPLRVRILDGGAGGALLADHLRSYDRGTQIEEPLHISALVAHKGAARQHRGMDRLIQAAPQARELLVGAAARNGNLGTITAALLRLLDRYGAAELQVAISSALRSGVPHPNAVQLALERQREARHAAPPVATGLSAQAKQKDRPIQPHRLDSYDQLGDNLAAATSVAGATEAADTMIQDVVVNAAVVIDGAEGNHE
jgi:hypothetical protein